LDGSILDDYAGEALNEDDPLYDETVQAKYILSSGEMTETPVALQNGKAIYGPLLTLPEFKIRLTETFREYFDSADSDEVIRSIEEMKCQAYYPEVIKKVVSLSLDEGPRERELVSRLLTCLHPTPLSDQDMEIGFELLLDGLDELVIDCPDAHVSIHVISKFFYVSIFSLHLILCFD
jgi:programmed cell death protein 4